MTSAAKTCERCDRELPPALFGKNKAKRDGLQGACKDCRRARHVVERAQNNARHQRWTQANLEAVRAKDRERYKAAPDVYKERAATRRAARADDIKEQQRRYRGTDKGRLSRRFRSLKANALKREIPFLLSKEDVRAIYQIAACPVCGVEMKDDGGRNDDRNKSTDRFDSTGPYSKGNCRCICYRCNNIKSTGTWEDHERIVIWMKKELLVP